MEIITIPLPYADTSLPLHVEQERLKAVLHLKTDQYDAGKG